MAEVQGAASTGSAKRAQDDADQMGTTEDREHDSQERVDAAGEPERDRLGNQDGAS